jgi:hypothetical protein
MAASKKSSRKATRKASASKTATTKRGKGSAGAARGKKAEAKARSTSKPVSAAPKTGVKEEHYADLRRVALANALARLR